MLKKWAKPLLTLLILLILAFTLPARPIDPWGILNLKKFASIIFALTAIQFMGARLIEKLGPKTGSILTGFLGGLISSTATTAALAKKSHESGARDDQRSEILLYLAATAAMLVEGIFIISFSSTEVHFSILFLFFLPLLVCILLILFNAKKETAASLTPPSSPFRILPILKLSSFILAIIGVSKILQTYFGAKGIVILTFFVSLFEIHGSFIANLQLHEANAFSLSFVGILFTVSIFASFCSKLFLVLTLGNETLKKKILQYTLILVLTSGLALGIFLILR